jgi:hypothetical protein
MRSLAKAKAPFQQAWAVDSRGVVEAALIRVLLMPMMQP